MIHCYHENKKQKNKIMKTKMLIIVLFVTLSSYGQRNDNLIPSNLDDVNYCNKKINEINDKIVNNEIENALSIVELVIVKYPFYVNKTKLLLLLNDVYYKLSVNDEIYNKWYCLYEKTRSL